MDSLYLLGDFMSSMTPKYALERRKRWRGAANDLWNGAEEDYYEAQVPARRPGASSG